MKFLQFVVIACLLIPAALNAQVIQGKVVSQDDKGISYAIVQVKEMNTGVYTNEQGAFTINALSGMTLIIHCLGYERTEIPVNDIQYPFIVKLAGKNMGLPEVVVKAKDPTLRVLGIKDVKPTGRTGAAIGYEQGIYLYDKKAKKATLEEVYVYIASRGIPDTPFRIHVYEASRKTKLPIKELTRDNIIAHADSADQWVRIYIKDKNIRVKGAIIITMEWLSGFDKEGALMGPSLGLATPMVKTYNYSKYNLQERKDNVFLPGTMPMIYCTYKK
jgi:hypothetical protein